MHTSRYTLTILLFVACALFSACGGASDTPTSPSAGVETLGNRGPVPPVTNPPPSTGTCVASQAQWAVGERASIELLERARVAAGAGVARFLRPNEAVTTDYSPARLNLGLDSRDVVTHVTCW
jgi:Peptidase inhibitor I78 family